MGRQSGFVIVSLLAVLAVAALGAFLLVAGNGQSVRVRPGGERAQPLGEGSSIDP